MTEVWPLIFVGQLVNFQSRLWVLKLSMGVQIEHEHVGPSLRYTATARVAGWLVCDICVLHARPITTSRVDARHPPPCAPVLLSSCNSEPWALSNDMVQGVPKSKKIKEVKKMKGGGSRRLARIFCC